MSCKTAEVAIHFNGDEVPTVRRGRLNATLNMALIGVVPGYIMNASENSDLMLCATNRTI